MSAVLLIPKVWKGLSIPCHPVRSHWTKKWDALSYLHLPNSPILKLFWLWTCHITWYYRIPAQTNIIWIRSFPYVRLDCQIKLSANEPDNFSSCSYPQMSEKEASLRAHWFKSSYNCGKYEQGKWRRNNCFPENHQDALKQSIYPSIYPQTVPFQSVANYRGLVPLAASTGEYVCICVYLCAKVNRSTAEKKATTTVC